jgi:hypothetical protein
MLQVGGGPDIQFSKTHLAEVPGTVFLSAHCVPTGDFIGNC